MKNSKISICVLLFICLLPIVTNAALTGLKGLLGDFKGVLDSTVPVLFGLSMIYFLWGVTQFILHDAGNEKTREEGKNKMIWGIVALFVFVSIYGILKFVGDAIGIPTPITGVGGVTSPTTPTLPFDPCPGTSCEE